MKTKITLFVTALAAALFVGGCASAAKISPAIETPVVKAIAAGGGCSFAPMSDGTMRTWGGNWYGGLGDGTTTLRVKPIKVLGVFDVTALSVCIALKADGSVWTWGHNPFGRIGDGTTSDRHIPSQVSGLTGVIRIYGGGHHSLALKADGTVWGLGTKRPRPAW